METQVSHFGEILLYLIGAVVFVAGGLITSKLIRPNRPSAEKLATYECGEDPVGTAWGQFNFRFYIIALVFLLFEVELVFIFPWATVFADKAMIDQTDGMWGWFAIAEMAVFVGLLVIGLAYVWRKGLLEWVMPKPQPPAYNAKIPKSAYEKYLPKS